MARWPALKIPHFWTRGCSARLFWGRWAVSGAGRRDYFRVQRFECEGRCGGVREANGGVSRGAAEGWKYAVEVRNPELLRPRYFDSLRAHNVPHVYNAWSGMPEIRDQIAIAGSRTSDRIVARALLRRGRPYADAVKKFAPYVSVQEVNEPVRQGLRELVDTALVDGATAFIFVNNRLEGNSPGTIVAITE